MIITELSLLPCNPALTEREKHAGLFWQAHAVKAYLAHDGLEVNVGAHPNHHVLDMPSQRALQGCDLTN